MVVIKTIPRSTENSISYPKPISAEEAMSRTGIKLWTYIPDNIDPEIHDSRFRYRFEITLTDSVLTNKPGGDLNQDEYEEELDRYERPHFHYTDEMRLIHDGHCYYDIQTLSNDWLRVELSAGDGLLIPAGVFHSVRLRVNGKSIFVRASGYYRSRGYSDDYVPIYEADQTLQQRMATTDAVNS